MPHIQSIRLVNVYFNNATQFYDDFSMEPRGHNMTYDLENGGGKSLLLLMTLQTVLPKSFLRKEKPLSLLFQGGKDRTSHVAVEWILEEGSSYKYLLTGFSARKRRGAAEPAGVAASEGEERLQAADIEHLNWCVFYNDYRIAGIKSIPLVTEESGKKSFVGFEEVRKYIQQMKQKGLPAEVFDKIDKYQGFISAQHLLPAEWNIIKGINSGENNIESYFRQNSTSRKLIENQFVKIVEDVEALNKEERSGDDSLLLADTLIEIRNRLNEYLRLQGHMSEFNRIKECYEEFGKRNEDFLKAYMEYEACKQQATAISNLIKNRLQKLAEENAEIQAQFDFNTAGSSEGQQLKRLLEAGLVNHEKERLLTECQHMEAERNQLADIQLELEEQLNRLLTLEGYGEYRQVKGKINENRQRLLNLGTGQERLLADYREAGGKLRFLIDKLFKDLEVEQEQATRTKTNLENDNEQAQQDLIQSEKDASVLDERVQTLVGEEVRLQDKLKELHDFFLKHGEMDAVLVPDKLLNRLEEEVERYQSELDLTGERMKVIADEIQELSIEVVKTEGEVNSNEESKKPLEGWLTDWQRELTGLEEKAANFGKSTIADYREGLLQLLHRESMSKLEREIDAGRLRQKKQLSVGRGYYVPNEEILSLASQLDSKCVYVQAGIDWLAQAEAEEKENILRQIPYLPYSVIVDGGSFDKLKYSKLKVDFSSDYPVPVVNLESVRLLKGSQNGDGSRDEPYYFCSFAGLLLDNGRYLEYLQGLDTELQRLDMDVISSGNRITELNRDLSAVDIFYGKYPQTEVETRKEALRTITKRITAFQEYLHGLMETKERLGQEGNELGKRRGGLVQLTAECQDKLIKLSEARDTESNLDKTRELLRLKRNELKTVQEIIVKNKEAIFNRKREIKLVGERLDGLLIELHDMKKEKEQLVSFIEVDNQEALQQVRARYQVLQEAVSGQHAEESELRKSLEDNETRLAKLKERILRDCGGDLEAVERDEESGQTILIPSPSVISEAKNSSRANSGLLNTAGSKVRDVREAIRKIEGKLEQILKGAGEDVEADLPRYDSEARYQQEIEQVELLIRSYDEEITRARAELERINGESSGLNRQQEDYQAFLEREEVGNDDSVAIEITDYRQFEKEFRRLLDTIGKLGDQWEARIKTIQAENVQLIIREPLEELGKISRPQSAAQCLTRRGNFSEYIANIDEQMQKILRDIVQLESYQEDFTRRCIQRAELVLGHLKKLESLSRIEVYGRRTNMIELKLQEFEEKEKQLRMKSHIDGIVRGIGEEGSVDRKRVSARLATKELLAQIADMDKAAVRLYKIESIPENSRFYRWENAIGSEGQNNSLYFIFAACLISFIRMLSITNIAVRTKKVIIADNPFGATSAVYLWDPMFKIMKQNDIQLIAPGHRIPREITSRFGVSYLLNQDILQDGRMRVVVKDVRAEEDEDVLRYIDSEQLAMF